MVIGSETLLHTDYWRLNSEALELNIDPIPGN